MTVPVSVLRDRWDRKLDAYGDVFQKTDRIVSGRKLDVVMRRDRIPPSLHRTAGWTDGKTITLNSNLLQEQLEDKNRDQARVIAYVKGVNYHELAHALFTPRIGENGSLAEMVKDEMVSHPKRDLLWMSFNILEDQRAETLFVARFRPSRHYFQAIALEYLLHDPATVPSQYPLVHHRLWIPEKTRKRMAKLYDQQVGIKGRAEAVGEVIDRYVRFVFPEDNQLGLEAIIEFADLLWDDPIILRIGPANHAEGHGDGSSDESVIGKGTINQKVQKKANKSIEDVVEQLADEQEEKGQAGDGGDEDADGDGGGSGADSEDGSDEDDGFDLGDVTDMLEEASEALEDLFEDQEFRGDLNRTNEAVKSSEAKTPGGIGKARGGKLRTMTKAVSTKDQSIVKSVVRELEELRFALEGTWITAQPSGKINPYKFMTINHDPGNLDIFDRWVEGVEDQGGFEVVLCVDRSGSMAGRDIVEASKASWILKRALEEVDGRVTVLAFTDRDHNVLYDPNDEAERHRYRLMDADGGTDPTRSLEEAYRLLDRSDKPNRMLITITDGGWYTTTGDSMVEYMGSEGIITALVGLGGAVKNTSAKGHQVAIDIDSMLELPQFVESMVAEVLKRIALRA